MSHPSIAHETAPDSAALRQNALSLLFFLLIVGALMLRFFVSPWVMNMVVNYTDDSGAIYEKLHFGTYAIFAVLPFALFSRPIYLRGDDPGKFAALVRYSVLILLFILYLMVMGRPSSSGFVIDSYLVAGAGGLLMFTVNPTGRRLIGEITVAMLGVSACIGIVEEITRHRLLPYGLEELVFRPLGLSEHPLALGALSATAIGFAVLTRWPTWVRVATIILLLVGTAASGARTALILAVVEVMALLILVPWSRVPPHRQFGVKAIVLALALLGGAALFGVMVAAGMLSRFGGSLFDENYAARVSIYHVFDYVGWQDIVFGKNLDDVMAIVNTQLQLPTIESAPVFMTFLFGMPLAIAFAGVVLWIYLRLLRGAPLPAKIAATVFMLAELSNNALSSKSPVITMILVLLIAFGGDKVRAAGRRETTPDRA